MFDVGGGELIFILIAALLLFGPKKIPEVAQMIGKGMREFRRAQDGLRAQIREVTADIDDPFTDKPVSTTKPFKAPEPVAPIMPLHEPEAPGQMSLLENEPKAEMSQSEASLQKEIAKENSTEPESAKIVIRPAENSVARPGRRSSSPPETP
ncbi:MAG TPA: twin-arginine translocase TatA/TatE family subunit [Patescibacteria group bacterium]|nr:twin-arginine translocase TatA/TatE family subunit [Patescibacteria group bacterium]